MVAINWRLGLVAFASVPPIVVASRTFGAFIRDLTKAYQKALADSTAVAEEALGAMRTVRAFAAEAEVLGAYERVRARTRARARRRVLLRRRRGGWIGWLLAPALLPALLAPSSLSRMACSCAR
jgi:subfamily B ATP-binding cassette protein MsbA